MRNYPSAISTYIETNHNAPCFVVVVKSGSTAMVRACNRGDIADWGGAGIDAEGVLVEVPAIRQSLDWRGGLGFFSEPEFKIAKPSIAGSLSGAMDYDIEVWFTLANGGSATLANSIQIYAGVVAGFSLAGNVVTIIGGDRRSKRYPAAILQKVDIDNEDNLCGFGLQQSAKEVWSTTPQFQEKWIPEATKGKFIPITFGRPERVRLVQVTNWPGAELLGASYDRRGPIFVMSDLSLDYGSGLITPIGNIYRVDGDSGNLDLATSNYNNMGKGQIYEVTGPWPAVCFGRSSGANNAANTGCINFFTRLLPQNRDEENALLEGDWAAFVDREYDWDYHNMSWPGLATVSSQRTVLMKMSFKDTRFPVGAKRFRHMYVEAFVEVATADAPLETNFQIRLRVTRNEDWSGHSDDWLDDIVALSNSRSQFNNIEGAGGSETWADGSISFGGGTPFQEGGSIGPVPLTSLVNEQIGCELYRIDTSDLSCEKEILIWQLGLILCCDFQIEEIADRLATDCEQSFDNYEMSRTGASDYTRAHETVYATLANLFGVSTANILAGASWATLAGSGAHDDHRLDFQLLDDKTGRELLDEMAMQSGIWLITDDSGDEYPVFFNRTRGRGADEVALDADFDLDNIESGSFTLDQGAEDDLFTQFRVRFNKDYFGSGYLDEVYVNETGGNATEISIINSVIDDWCTKAQAKHGVTRELVFDADMIQDRQTAEQLLRMLAAKLVDRPWIARFSAPLEAVKWQLGDFPCLAHPLFLDAAEKYSNSNSFVLSFEATGSDYKFVISSASNNSNYWQDGDWLLADVDGAGLSGWYRIKDIQVTSDVALIVDAPAGASGTYDVDSIAIYPAMMVTAQEIRGGKVEMELTEIPRNPL